MTQSSPLIDAATLLERVRAGDPHLRIADCRWVLGGPGAGETAYLGGHLPGAIHIDLDEDLADRDGYGAPGAIRSPPRPRSPRPWAGPGSATTISSSPTTTSAAGSPPGCGGCSTSSATTTSSSSTAGSRRGSPPAGELTTEVPALAPAELHLAERWSGVIDREELRARLGSVVLLDARGAPRYRGETEPIDPVAGHIPTARSAPIDDSLAEPNGRFRSATELAGRFRELGADGSAGPVVTSCGSGVSALHHALSLRLAGLPDPILYVGSYSDWSRSGEPVATGAEPGEPPVA